ncbi:hypothetical protein J5X84_00360 [Streptosporangiaceae bacterium NEAU-GS5]|nr:hypothetical protein [Streptosporangiaceae bacterium NEAU-GS5]
MWASRRTSQWALLTGVYDPVVGADGLRWRDYERAAEAVGSPLAARSFDAPPAGDRPAGDRPAEEAERPPAVPDWFDRADRPPPLAESRPYGVVGGLAPSSERAQLDLEHAVPGRFPDPRGTWIRLINAEGPIENPFRSTNAVDCALAVMSAWHGEPVVAAARHPEYDPDGKPMLTGESGGVARAQQWLAHRFEYVGQGPQAYAGIAQRLRAARHGAAAVLITRWPNGGSHAWNAINSNGEVVWIDAQRGHMAVEPPYDNVTGVFCVVMDHRGRSA